MIPHIGVSLFKQVQDYVPKSSEHVATSQLITAGLQLQISISDIFKKNCNPKITDNVNIYPLRKDPEKL